MKKPLKVLHVEDSQEDSELVEEMLRRDGLECEIKRVETRGELFEALERSNCDLILSDCTLPAFNGLQALEVAHALKPQVPFIFVSGTIGEETAIKSLQNGATDYVLKHRLSRLVPAVRRALTEAEERNIRREMEKRLHQARRLEGIGTLAGGLAHDFNNLLQVFKAHIALLSLEAGNPEQIAKIAETLDKAADRGSGLMRELLVFARKTEANLSSIDVSLRINETVDMIRASMPSHVTLITKLEEGLPHIFADPGQIDRILTNLIVNAKDAMPQGGTVTISSEVVQFDPAPPHSWQSDDVLYFCLKVADTGIGMDEATRLHAFEPFFTTKPLEKGTGLGLSVVFGLMQVHNGFIDVQSKPGEGTTFSLFFPLLHGARVDSAKIKKLPPFHLLGGATQHEALAA